MKLKESSPQACDCWYCLLLVVLSWAKVCSEVVAKVLFKVHLSCSKSILELVIIFVHFSCRNFERVMIISQC